MKQKQQLKMKELPQQERPYEKCMQYGMTALSDAELLAVVIRTGNRGERCTELAARLLCELPNENLSGLFRMTLEQLTKIRGIGKVKGIQLLCLTEIARRMMTSGLSEHHFICSEPGVVASRYMAQMQFLETEQVRMLILDAKNVLKQDVIVSSGSFTTALAEPREIFYSALSHGAISIILLHNHPSGDPSPSREDLMTTKRLLEVGELIGIPLLDHIIIGNNRYISMKESRYGF